jgi:hypothetical protein
VVSEVALVTQVRWCSIDPSELQGECIILLFRCSSNRSMMPLISESSMRREKDVAWGRMQYQDILIMMMRDRLVHDTGNRG